MKIRNEEVLRGLINIFNINGYRIEVYKKLQNKIYDPVLRNYFQKQVDESSIILKELNPILNLSLKESENSVVFEDAKMDQSQFYFSLACASNNPRTVMVSCQFGNEFLIKAYQKILDFLNTNAFDELWLMVSKHLKSIKDTYMDFEHDTIIEMPTVA